MFSSQNFKIFYEPELGLIPIIDFQDQAASWEELFLNLDVFRTIILWVSSYSSEYPNAWYEFDNILSALKVSLELGIFSIT